MKILKYYYSISDKFASLEDIPTLLLRITLAYGLYNPAMMKLNNIDNVAEWFGSMGIPFPVLNAYLAGGTELAGVILLTVGLFTRLISVPLMVVMLVAIFTVHLNNGFEAGENGFEIPLYYLMMLLVLFVKGAGKLSIDSIIKKNILR